uniref:Uncharacterized protein TCIL3000_10_4090 n=1 Tax=Trypanosoma congolense (strain IL3000) TaxID=1068625 RepID=G0UW80_TRYCI|nr:unnamed protein product [Trypanosoma congolense IL3000]
MEAKKGTLSSEALRDEGNKAFKSGAFHDAIKFYSQAIELDPNEAALLSNRSASYIKVKEFRKAAADAEGAIASDRTFAKAYSRLHNALCHLGRFEEAAQKLGNAVSILENCEVSLEDKRNVQELHKDAERGRKAFETGRHLLEQLDFVAAERELAPLAQSFPDCAIVGIMLGESRAARFPESVIGDLAAFSSTHSNDPYYLYVRSLATYYLGPSGFVTAQSILRHTIEMDPDNRKAVELLKKIRAIESQKTEGNNAFKNKQFADAINFYSAAMAIDLTNVRLVAVLRGNQAAAKMELKNFSSALLDCDFAINNGAGNAKLYARRSRIHQALDNHDDALRDIQRAAEMDSSYSGEAQQAKINAKRAKRKDYYKILGISQGEADEASVKRAYKKSCLQWHPDKWAHASEEEKAHAEKMFKDVGEAFSILSDPQKKRLYDSGQLDNASSGVSGAGFPVHNGDVFEMMNMMFQGNFGQGGMHTGFSFSVNPNARRHKRQSFRFM